MKKRDDMTFPYEEYERRISELRSRIAERHLDAVVITDPENIMYLTDYQTTGYSFFQALVVPLEDEPFMITRALEESNIFARTWVVRPCLKELKNCFLNKTESVIQNFCHNFFSDSILRKLPYIHHLIIYAAK